jgi:hypothetical protein
MVSSMPLLCAWWREADAVVSLVPKQCSKMMFAITCVLASLALASGAVEGDRITKLPGFVGDLPSTHYSGCEFSCI